MDKIYVPQKSIQWFAGLFEGEGTIFRNDSKRSLAMTIKMCDEDVLLEILKTIKVGKVSTRKPPTNPNHSQTYLWGLYTRNEIIDLSNAILPYMGIRRSNKIKEVLSGLKRLPPKRNLKIVPPCGLLKPTDSTNKGQKRHLLKGEKPCKDCASSARNYMSNWRKTNPDKRYV